MKRFTTLLGAVSASFLLASCGPAKIDVYEEIKPNETAFVIPLEGATQSKQKEFGSVDYLQQNKVAKKRIYLPQKKVKIGRMPWEYKYVPTVDILRVDRTPITMQWEVGGKKEDAICVETKDSIGFCVGTSVTAKVEETNTALFLYNFPSGELKRAIDNNVYAKATAILSAEFAKYNLEGEPATYDKDGNIISKAVPGAREMKTDIIDVATTELTTFFGEMGVTITTFGLVGGMEYNDPAIQEAINDNIASELDIVNKRNMRLAAAEVNKTNIERAVADKEAALEFKKAESARTAQVMLEIEMINAQANLEFAKNVSGQLPSVVPSDSPMLFGLGK